MSRFISMNLWFMMACMTLGSVTTGLADPPLTNGHPQRRSRMAEESAQFEEAAGHPFGFDDFTNWSRSASDYYGTRRMGICTLPYASVVVGVNGTSYFWFKSIPSQPTVTFSVDNSHIDFLPKSTTISRAVVFSPSSGFYSSAILDASIDSTKIARLQVQGFSLRTLRVGVRLVNETHWNSTDFPTQSIQSVLSAVFRQACININVIRLDTITLSFDKNNNNQFEISKQINNNGRIIIDYDWMNDEMRTIFDAGDDATCDYIVFFVNRPSKSQTTGLSSLNQKFAFVFGDTDANLYTIAHELGHALGLGHTFETDNPPNSQQHDKDNLMDPCKRNNKSKLRYSQWLSLRSAQ